MSIQDIQQNPQDTSNFYLANIYQTLAEPNRSNTLTSPPSSPPPFSPPNHAVWVNALWFMSLVISLTCALLATFLQQWARRYLKTTQSRYSPHKRARIRAFFSEGVDKCLLPWTVDALPTLLHISLFLFFAGLVVFLCNVNLTIFKLVLSWVGLCAALYGCFTCMPIIRHDSPYHTPLSFPAWYVVTGIQSLFYRFLRWFNGLVRFRYAYYRYLYLEKCYRKSLVRGMQKAVEETALRSPPEIDTRAFMWTFDCLDEDDELERFFAGLPGFRTSNVVNDPVPSLTDVEKLKLSEGLRGLLDRTFSSDLLLAPVKDRRAMICEKAIDPEHTPNALILHATLFKYQHSSPLAAAIANILRQCENNMSQHRISDAQIDISEIITTRHLFDDSWYTLASNILGFTETSLRDYAAHGDSLSLVILIHFIRMQFTHFRKSYWLEYNFSDVLDEASNFDAKNTSPELQHKFCALWNQIVNKTQGSNDRQMAGLILSPIRNVFLALHQDTDSAPTQFSASTGYYDDVPWSPSSYPICKVLDHHSDSTAPLHDDHAPTTFTPAVPDDHDNTALVPSLPSPKSLPSSTCAPLPIGDALTDKPPVDNTISLPVPTTPVISSSPSPVTSCAIRGSIDNYPMTTHLSVSELSTSDPLSTSYAPASPLDDVAVGRTKLSHTLSDDTCVRSSPFPARVLDAILPKGLLLFSGRNWI